MHSLERKLGSIENLFHIIHDFGGMIDVNIARLEGEIVTNIVRQALDLLQTRHPMLRVGIVELPNGAYFSSQGIKKIPLRTITKTNENQWLDIFEEELHQKFSEDFTPLCRITLLSSSPSNGISEIVLTFHHAITDGLSCMSFIDELLFYYQKIAAGEKISHVNKLPFLAPIEQTLDRSFVNLNKIEKPENKNIKELRLPKLIIETEAPLNQRRTHLVKRIIRSETVLNLKQRCKQEKTTVHGALSAAMLFGAIQISAFNEPISFSCSSSINLRKYNLPEIGRNYIGCFISRVDNIHTLTENTNFWDLARECKKQVNSSINETINNLINGKGFDNISRLSIRKSLEENSTGRTQTINISNRGKFDLAKSYGKLKIKEIYFTAGQHIFGPCLWLGAVTFHQQLFCSFVHVTPLISSTTMNYFADNVVSIIEKASLYESLCLNNYQIE